MLVEVEQRELPAADDLLGLARVWRRVFHPQGHPRDFIEAWRRCIGNFSAVA
jgi:hypothetical protein